MLFQLEFTKKEIYASPTSMHYGASTLFTACTKFILSSEYKPTFHCGFSSINDVDCKNSVVVYKNSVGDFINGDAVLNIDGKPSKKMCRTFELLLRRR